MRMLDTTSSEGAALVGVLLAASGELESACLVGNRYQPADLAALAALTTSAAGRVQKVVADLAFWTLQQRRQPASADPKNCPGALQALEELDRLRNGERIFGFAEAGAAGNPDTVDPDSSKQSNPLVDNSSRLFGTHADRTGQGNIRRPRC
jgi:hypothetical protein